MAIIQGNTVLARQEILLSQTSREHSFWVLKHDIWRLLLNPTTLENKIRQLTELLYQGLCMLQVKFDFRLIFI